MSYTETTLKVEKEIRGPTHMHQQVLEGMYFQNKSGIFDALSTFGINLYVQAQ